MDAYKEPESNSDVLPPLVIETPDSFEWQDQADVVVVGYGAAGASAALEAHESGMDVLLIDRFGGGGATAKSGGVVYAGATRFQREAGYDDTAEEMYKYVRMEVGDVVKDETTRRFCEESNANLEWLVKHGVAFNSAVHEARSIAPPENKYLYYTSNEKVAKYAAQSKPAPRGHRAYGGKGLAGYMLFRGLRDAVERSGMRTLLHAPVRRLVTDRDGNIVGLEVALLPERSKARHQKLYDQHKPLINFLNDKAERVVKEARSMEAQASEFRFVRARRGVVLAAGGFSYNVAMLKQYVRPTLSNNHRAMARCGSIGCSGAGIRLGQSVGGDIAQMDTILAGRVITQPEALVRGIVVGRSGRRFINEDAYQGSLGEAMSLQPEGMAWLICDRPTFRAMLRQLLPGDGQLMLFKIAAALNIAFGGTHRGKDLHALAMKCGVDPDGLVQELKDYNAAAKTGRDPLGKETSYVVPLEETGPYYAINVSLSNMFASTLGMTLGGLTVNEESGAVTRSDGSDVKGLYAAGRTAVGLISNGCFGSGISLADCVFSGRRAGRALAALGNGPSSAHAHQ